MSRIDSDIQNICPNCQEAPQDTTHIFNCTSKPTQLTNSSLWDKPQKAASFLGLYEEKRSNDRMIGYNNNNQNKEP